MAWHKLYIGGVLQTTLPAYDFSYTGNIQDYIPIAEFKVANPNGINVTKVSQNDTIKLEFHDKDTTAFVERFEGYVSRIDNDDINLTVKCQQWGGRMYQRNATEAYNHWEVAQIVKDLAEKYLPEFTTNNVDQTGTETIDAEQTSQDGTVTLDGANKKYSQMIAPTKGNIVKVSIYIDSATGAQADFQLRSDDAALPSTYDILQQKSNVVLTTGWNTVYLSRKNLVSGTDYWLLIIWKAGTFTIGRNGAIDNGKVAYSNADPENWATQNVTDLRYRIYWTDGIIIENIKFGEQKIADCYKQLVDLLSTEWVYYVDNDKDVHFEEETFSSSDVTITDETLFKIGWANEGKKVYNIVRVHGGERVTANHSSNLVGDGTTETFSFSPGNPVKPLKKVTVAGTEKIEDTDFTVDYDVHTITFGTAPGAAAAIVIIHDYRLPVIAEAQDPVSIAQYEERMLAKSDRNIVSNSHAQEVADALLRLYNESRVNQKAERFFKPTLKAGDVVTFDVTRTNITGEYLIYRINHKMGRAGLITTINAAAQEVLSVPEVLKELKATLEILQLQDMDHDAPVTDLRTFYETLTITELLEISALNICDSFILDHPENSKLEMGIILDEFESGVVANWISGEFTISENSTGTYVRVGSKSLKAISASGQTGYITSTQSLGDVSAYTGESSGTPSQGTVGVWLYVATGSKLSDLKLRIGSSASDYIEITATEKTHGSLAFDDGWNYFVFDLDNPDSTVGTPDWTACDYVRFEVTTTEAEDFYLDYFTISKSNSIGLNGQGYRTKSTVA